MNGFGDVPAIPLWPDGSPGRLNSASSETVEVGADGITRVSRIHDPALYVFPCEFRQANPPGLLLCPGGAYSLVSIEHEGSRVARRLNQAGLHVFVLKYRLAPYRHPVPLTDAKQALRILRSSRTDLPLIGPLGVMGFSAGGHLAATLLTEPGLGAARPDFGILGYPVISLVREFCAHRSSMENLLGADPPEPLRRALSADLRVSRETPPTFLFHALDDVSVPPENSRLFAAALCRAGVGTEAFFLETGGHGFGPCRDEWVEPCLNWLRRGGLLHGETS